MKLLLGETCPLRPTCVWCEQISAFNQWFLRDWNTPLVTKTLSRGQLPFVTGDSLVLRPRHFLQCSEASARDLFLPTHIPVTATPVEEEMGSFKGDRPWHDGNDRKRMLLRLMVTRCHQRLSSAWALFVFTKVVSSRFSAFNHRFFQVG